MAENAGITHDGFNQTLTMATFAGHILGDFIDGQDWNKIGNSGGIIRRMHQCKTDMLQQSVQSESCWLPVPNNLFL